MSMDTAMDSLYESQKNILEAMTKLLSNMKKDPADRRTVDNCRRKMEMLDLLWSEYDANNKKLLPYESIEHQYFQKGEFELTKKLYRDIKAYIENLEGEIKTSAGRTAAGQQPAQQQQTKQPPGKPQTGTSAQQQISVTQQQAVEPAAQPAVQYKSRGTNSKLDDLLRKQTVNFKAFIRTVNTINIESVSEKWEFQDLLKSLDSRWTVIDSVHWDIIDALEGEEDDAYESMFSRHESTYNRIKKALNSKMWSVSHIEKSTPTIELPVFTGSYQQWVSFRDLFLETIHKNPSLSSAQKMQFLKSKVKGDAERLIQHLSISSENYSICWKILDHRFENKKLIFTSHVNTLLNLPNMQTPACNQIKKLHDITVESLHAIKNQGVDISTWDPLLVHLLSQKLDSITYGEYVESLGNSRELPILQDFLDFLELKFITMESARRRQECTPKSSNTQQQPLPHQVPTQKFSATSSPRKAFVPRNGNNENVGKPFFKYSHASTSIKCPLCEAEHGLFMCDRFLNMPNDIKLKTLNNHQLCINCLYDHRGKKCISTKTCRACNNKHNTLLHDALAKQKSQEMPPPVTRVANNRNNNSHVSQSQGDASEILLTTALIKVTSRDGNQHIMRALIDQGSQISLISERAAQQLGIKRQSCNGVIFGIGEKENNCKGMLDITCQSLHSDFVFNARVMIMNNLIKNLPQKTFSKPAWSHISDINLADPEFYVSRPVDILLGAEIYSLIMMDGIIRGDETRVDSLRQRDYFVSLQRRFKSN